MKENKIRQFVDYMSNHLSFSIEVFENINFPDTDVDPKDFHKLPRSYDRVISGGQNNNEFLALKDEVLIFLTEIFEKYKIAYERIMTSSIEYLESYNSEFTTLEFDGNYYRWHKRITLIKGNTNEDAGIYIDKNFYVDDYSKISNYIEQQVVAINDIISFHISLLESIGGASLPKKITTNFTVPELSMLFRLLYDTKKIKSENSKMDICRMISASFKTEATENISVSSLYNNWNTIDTNTIERIKQLMSNMRSAYLDFDK